MFGQMRISRKLQILCVIFSIPIAFLLYLFITQTNKDVAFAEKELIGNAYFSAARDELIALIDFSQKTGSADELMLSQKTVLTLDRQNGEDMKARESSETAAKEISAVLSAPQPGAAGAAIDAVMDHIAKIEDGSNLTLDPDLDSFYTQDLVTVKIPALAVALHRALRIGADMLADDKPSPEKTVAFLSGKADVANALSGIQGDIASGQRGNPDGTMRSLTEALAALNDSTAAFSGSLEKIAVEKGAGSSGGAACRAAATRNSTGGAQIVEDRRNGTGPPSQCPYRRLHP